MVQCVSVNALGEFSLMETISRGNNCRTASGKSKRFLQFRCHLLDRRHAVYPRQHPFILVVRHDRCGLIVIDRKPIPQRFRVVIGTFATGLRCPLLDSFEQNPFVHSQL